MIEILVKKIPKYLPEIRTFENSQDKKDNYGASMVNPSNYVVSLNRSYFLAKIIGKELSLVLCKANFPDFERVFRALEATWTLIFDNLVEYSKQTAARLTA